MADILALLLPWILTTTALFLALAADEARLTPEQSARAWPPATRRMALVVFGVMAVPVHVLRTRRGIRAVALALFAFAVAVVASTLVATAVDLALGAFAA